MLEQTEVMLRGMIRWPGNNVMIPNLNAGTLQALGSRGFVVLFLS